MINSVFDITMDFSYLNHLISEPYNTIWETNFIKYMETIKVSYVDTKTSELYISVYDIDISTYTIISMVELIDVIQETRAIIYMGRSCHHIPPS